MAMKEHQTWEYVITELENITNPEELKSLYIDCVTYLASHEIAKSWRPRLNNYFFLYVYADTPIQDSPVLTFESTDAVRQLCALILDRENGEKEKIRLSRDDYKERLDNIIRKLNEPVA